jgi:uncharacterized membrane protein YgcG
MIRTFVAVTLLLLTGWTQAQTPVINRYDTLLSVFKNSDMTVTETINITTDGQRIKHGIFRDIPIYYQTKQGANFNIGFHLLSVKRDNQDEPFFIQQKSNGIRIYIGSKNRLLPPGTYTYEIAYAVDRAIGFFDSHDELYWNVTGNGWDFPITKATALLILPSDAKINRVTAFTGAFGSRAGNVDISFPNTNEAQWVTQAPLPPHHGLTVVAAWPKGIITKPSFADQIGYFARDNSAYLFAGLGLVCLIGFYFIAWFYMGRDPKAKTIIPLFEPPEGLSPQALRYIKKMRYDNKMFTAAIVNMAVKHHLTIHKTGKNYTLERINPDQNNLSVAERSLSNALFETQSKIVISQDNQPTIAKAVDSFKKSMKAEFENKYFIRNSAIIIVGIIISLLSLFPLFQQYTQMLVPMLAGAFAVVLLIQASITLRESYQENGLGWATLSSAAISTFILIAIFFFVAQDFFRSALLLMGMAGLFALVNTVFYYLMKRPTMLGAKAIHHAKGFELFLKATEEDRLNFRNPPDKTPELFEALLPFALALGLEQAWSNQFANMLAKSQYQPSWYTGTYFGDFNPASFSQSVGSSLSSAISSASVAPGSSSGFSGGGSSGGGGGGGGGGW